MSATVAVTDATFRAEVEEAPGLTLVDFWAPWCGPCRVIAPVLEQLAGEHAGRVRIAKLDMDENPATAARFGIRSAPTLLFFRGGELVERIVGAVPKPRIEAIIQARG